MLENSLGQPFRPLFKTNMLLDACIECNITPKYEGHQSTMTRLEYVHSETLATKNQFPYTAMPLPSS